MNKVTLRQPYSLTTAKYKLSLPAQRILLRIIEQLQPYLISKRDLSKNLSENETLKLKIKSLLDEDNQNDSTIAKAIEDLNSKGLATDLLDNKIITLKTRSLLPEGSQNYTTLKKALKELRSIDVTIKTDKSEVYTGLILEAEYLNNNSFVSIKISSRILPHYLFIAKGYTKYSLTVAFRLSSPYTVKFYMKLCHWRDKKILNVMLDDLRELLQLGEKYKDSTDVKNCVLLPAQRDLKKNADVWFEIKEPIKNSRKVIGWKLEICKKEKPDLTRCKIGIRSEETIKYLTNTFKLSKRQAEKIELEARKNPDIIKPLKKELHGISLRTANKEISNIGGYTAKVIEEKFEIKMWKR